MDVGGWLRSLGLGQYEANLRDNKIDVDVLADLTDGDLEKLGLPLGDRKRLLKAVASLAATAPSAPSSSVSEMEDEERPKGGRAGASRPSGRPAPRDTAERRPITVMFCDLVGSTGIAAKLDAEDWRNFVSAYLDAASEAVAQMGGRVAKTLGDGLMALFGHPIAQENDSERAVRAALAIQRALAELNHKNAASGRPELVARIGVESGAVVVESTGEVFGEAPNVAARVQGLADPGTVLVTWNVQRQTAGLFVAEDRGAHALKGVPTPVALYRIVRASGGRRLGARALTPLVGREEELDLLRRRWVRAVTGEGQLALVVGEPGVGKSRLVEEFRLKLAETPHTWAEFSSSQLFQNTPLHPIAEWGRQRFGADEPAARRLADLENTLRLIGLDPAEYGRLLAPLVDIPLPKERAAKLAPEELRRRQLAAITAWVLASARSQPVVQVFEDLHWADPTTLDLIQALAWRGAQAPLLILATTRPEFHPHWSLRSHHSVISLSPLDRADVAQMVGELASPHTLSQEVVEGVSERTGGVPLFVEEVTRLLLERGEAGGLQAIPPTLQQSLAARLDRLGEAREVAQTGAVLGRDFTYSLLRGVVGVDDPALQSALDRLAGADLLIAEGGGPQANYRFKHALIQEAAYDSLLKSRRQALHRRAAELLRAQPERAAAASEVIAHHFTQAGLDDLAIEWWGKAGGQALRRSAFQEAVAHLGKAIAMADKADGGKAACDLGGRAQLHVAYGNALFAVRGQGAPETTEAFARARERASGDEDAPERLAADYGLWAGSYQRGELSAMRAHAETFLGDVGARPDSPEVGVAHRAAGITHWFAGEYREAREHLEQALALFEPGHLDSLGFRFGFLDSGVGAMGLLPMALWPLGDIERAVSLALDADARNATLPHAGARAHGKGVVAMFALMRGDLSRAASNGVELVQLAREHDLSLVLGLGVFLEGVATAESGAAADGLEQMRRGELLRGTNFPSYDGLIKIALAQVEARAGDVDRAIAILDEALATVQRTGCHAFEAELNRVRGEMLLKRDPASPVPAKEALQAAIAVAQRQGTRSFELRAALSLAKLYQSTRRPLDAHAVLAPALEGFSPTPEMPEIAEAKELLAALAETDEVKAEAARRQQRLQLHVAYGNALFAARGPGAPETAQAFARAHESAVGDNAAHERLSADFGLWVGSYVRGELAAMREHSTAFLSDVEARPASPEAGVAHRMAGITHWFAGEYVEAREHIERALALFQPGRDDDLAFRFGHDAGVAAMLCLALTLWPLGDIGRAVSLVGDAEARSAGLAHIATRAHGKQHAALFEVMRGDLSRVAPNAIELARLAREHDLPHWRAYGVFFEGVASAESGASRGGLDKLRHGAKLLRDRHAQSFDGLIQIALSEAEARAGDVNRALAILDETLATCEGTGHRAFEAELHRVRGEMLLKRDPADPAPAEEALLTAIAVAKGQATRSFELRAALALAKLCQATARPAEAHPVLSSALEGFAPTAEMPEIAEAQTLLRALGTTDELKAETARRQRRAQLQAAYGNALLAARGMGAAETTEAFARARESRAGDKDAPERLSADYGLWVGSIVRGELSAARAYADAFLRDVETKRDSPEAGVAHRTAGITHWFAGEFAEARDHLERAIALFEPGRDDDLAFRFGQDAGVAAMLYLAIASWPLGDVEPAVSFVRSAEARIAQLAHVPTRAYGINIAAWFDLMRGDLSRAARNSAELAQLACEHDLPQYRAIGIFLVGLAKADSGAFGGGLEDMRRGVALYREQNPLVFDGLINIALAEAEARAGDAGRALAILDEALGTSERTGQRAFDAELHRVRGEMLLKRDPADALPAEGALQSAIAVAKRQGARSFGLRAALSLAKLYQSTARPTEAHALLAPALEGFAPTPEMPEIAEAKELLAVLTQSSARNGSARR